MDDYKVETRSTLGMAAFGWKVISIVALLCAAIMAQAQANPKATSTPSPAPLADENARTTHEDLVRLVKLTPRLATMIVHDPSLLGENSYIDRNNPQLGQFLQQHPEVARNPEFYLFANFPGGEKRNRESNLRRENWEDQSPRNLFMIQVMPFLVFGCLLMGVLWLVKRVLENVRWSRAVRIQTDLHNKLMDRFSSNEQLLSFMNSDAGQRLLQSMQAPLSAEPQMNGGNPMTRVFSSLQSGVVLTLLGIGLLFVSNNVPDGASALLVLGTIGLMLGIGFIIGAGLSFMLARHLGMLPKKAANDNSAIPDAKSSY